MKLLSLTFLILFGFFYLFIENAIAQTNPAPKKDSAAKENKKEKIYPKIQSGDERMIELMVYKQVREEVLSMVRTWGAIIVIFLGVLGFFGFRGLDAFIRTYSERIILEQNKKVNRELYEFQFRFELNEFKDNLYRDKNYTEILDKAKTNLEKTKDFENKKIAEGYLDLIVLCNFYLRRDTDNLQLLNKYGREYDFSYQSYANVAISAVDKFELSGQARDKEMALNYANEALKKLPNYGTAQAIRLITHAIDFVKAGNSPTRKEEIKLQIKQVFDEILQGSSLVAAYETNSYLMTIKEGTIFYSYLNILRNLFPEQMQEIDRRNTKYLGSGLGTNKF